MRQRSFKTLVTVVIVFGFISLAQASIDYDQNVTNNVIYGSGNNNGGFTTFRTPPDGDDVELGLRAHTRFPTPSDTPVAGGPGGILSHGDGVYGSFEAQGYTGAGTTPGPLGSWNFDWSINSSVIGVGGNVGTLTYQLDIDYDPGPGTNFLSFDPVNLVFADHSFGDNTTGPNAGTEAIDPVTYATLVASSNLVQNSWNLGFPFLAAFAPQPYDPNASGLYDIQLSAFKPGPAGPELIGTAGIQVEVGAQAAVPEAASLVIWCLLGLACSGICGRRGR
jgi:hypothetical protein